MRSTRAFYAGPGQSIVSAAEGVITRLATCHSELRDVGHVLLIFNDLPLRVSAESTVLSVTEDYADKLDEAQRRAI